MFGFIGGRAIQSDRVVIYDVYYSAFSATMFLEIIGGVTAANATIIR